MKPPTSLKPASFKPKNLVINFAKRLRETWKRMRNRLKPKRLGPKRIKVNYPNSNQMKGRGAASTVTHNSSEVLRQINRSASPGSLARGGGMARMNRGVRASGGTIRRHGATK